MTKPSEINGWPRFSAQRRGRIARARTVLIGGFTAVALGACANADRVEYIPADRGVIPLQAGEPAPSEGWFVPPSVMQEIVPCLDERFQNGAPLPAPPRSEGEDASEAPENPGGLLADG